MLKAYKKITKRLDPHRIIGTAIILALVCLFDYILSIVAQGNPIAQAFTIGYLIIGFALSMVYLTGGCDA